MSLQYPSISEPFRFACTVNECGTIKRPPTALQCTKYTKDANRKYQWLAVASLSTCKAADVADALKAQAKQQAVHC
jgi:hypothetical protein